MANSHPVTLEADNLMRLKAGGRDRAPSVSECSIGFTGTIERCVGRHASVSAPSMST